MNRNLQRLQAIKAAAANCQRRRQLALLVERLEEIERVPVRDEEQARLKAKAIRELVEGADPR